MWDGVNCLENLVDVEACISKEMIQIRDGYIHGGVVVNYRPIEQGDDSLSNDSTLGAGALELALGRHDGGRREVGKIEMKTQMMDGGMVWTKERK